MAYTVQSDAINSIDHTKTQRETHTCVKGIFAKLLRKLHEVALDKLDLIFEASILGFPTCAADLEGVVVHADDVHIREARNLPGGAADATADVEDAHPGTKGHLRGEVVLVASEGRHERLALVEAREMERLAPAVLIEVRCAVVVA